MILPAALTQSRPLALREKQLLVLAFACFLASLAVPGARLALVLAVPCCAILLALAVRLARPRS